MAIRILATTKLHDALILSNAGFSPSFDAGKCTCVNRLSINLLIGSGRIRLIIFEVFTVALTIVREAMFEEKRSSPSFWRDKSTVVATTDFAFRLVIRVMIITKPEISNIYKGVSTLPFSISMVNPSGEAPPDADQA